MMCDKECAARFQRIELKINTISMDMKWFKRLAGGLLILISAVFGIDASGMV